MLENEDSHVRLSAAVDCLKINLYVEHSVEVLKNVSKNENEYLAYMAERNLLIWEGKLEPDQP